MLRRQTILTALVSAGAVLLAVAVGLAVDAMLVPGASAATQPWAAATGSRTSATSAATCNRAAPSTAAGYTNLWSSLDPGVWGGADVSISVPLADGRELWLYGDTMSGPDPQHLTRFVHSSAIVQSGGCLHVANAGQQLLPDVDRDHWYWIQGAVVHGSAVTVRARLIARTGQGVWDFADAGYAASFVARVDAEGNVHVTGSPIVEASPPPDPGPMLHLDNRPHHFGYARVVHQDITLAGDHMLVTTCQNWDGPGAARWADEQPLFTAVPR